MSVLQKKEVCSLLITAGCLSVGLFGELLQQAATQGQLVLVVLRKPAPYYLHNKKCLKQ